MSCRPVDADVWDRDRSISLLPLEKESSAGNFPHRHSFPSAKVSSRHHSPPASHGFLLHRYSSLLCAPFAVGIIVIDALLRPPPRITWAISTAASELAFLHFSSPFRQGLMSAPLPCSSGTVLGAFVAT
jgi:hypothetical protein